MSRLGPGDPVTENTWSWRLVSGSSAIRDPGSGNGDSGSSRSVAEISASMICPGVISIGMPRSGVGGLGGELGREMKEVSEDRETGEVGSDTVIGGLVFKFRLAVDMVLVILLVLPTTGLTATILLPSAEDTTISL